MYSCVITLYDMHEEDLHPLQPWIHSQKIVQRPKQGLLNSSMNIVLAKARSADAAAAHGQPHGAAQVSPGPAAAVSATPKAVTDAT